MKNDKSWTPFVTAGVKSIVLTALFAAALISCGKSGNRPMPPQAPPKPQVQSVISPSDVEHAVFTYTRTPSIHYQNGLGLEIPVLVIRT